MAKSKKDPKPAAPAAGDVGAAPPGKVSISQEDTQGRVLVRATQLGYYGLSLRQPGEQFYLDHPSHFGKKWMEKVGD